jgi:hypothetical protein
VRIRNESIAVLWRITLFAGLSERELKAFTSRSTPVYVVRLARLSSRRGRPGSASS